jgi:hypothetical protein
MSAPPTATIREPLIAITPFAWIAFSAFMVTTWALRIIKSTLVSLVWSWEKPLAGASRRQHPARIGIVFIASRTS